MVMQLESDTGNNKEMAACLWLQRRFFVNLEFGHELHYISSSMLEVKKDWLATTLIGGNKSCTVLLKKTYNFLI